MTSHPNRNHHGLKITLHSDNGSLGRGFIDGPEIKGPVATIDTYAGLGFGISGASDWGSAMGYGRQKSDEGAEMMISPLVGFSNPLRNLHGCRFKGPYQLANDLMKLGYTVLLTHSGGTYYRFERR